MRRLITRKTVKSRIRGKKKNVPREYTRFMKVDTWRSLSRRPSAPGDESLHSLVSSPRTRVLISRTPTHPCARVRRETRTFLLYRSHLRFALMTYKLPRCWPLLNHRSHFLILFSGDSPIKLVLVLVPLVIDSTFADRDGDEDSTIGNYYF